jgi:hypothetical protein
VADSSSTHRRRPLPHPPELPAFFNQQRRPALPSAAFTRSAAPSSSALSAVPVSAKQRPNSRRPAFYCS